MLSIVYRLTTLKHAFALSCAVMLGACAQTPIGNKGTDNTLLYAINAGGKHFIAQDGTAYAADHYVKGGSFGASTDAIQGTQDQTLFQSERWGRFSYGFPVKSGDYDIKLHMAETWFGPAQTGLREFDVVIEGQKQLAKVNPLKAVGHDRAYSVTVNNILVDDGELSIDFLPLVDSASVRGIEIYGAAGNRLEGASIPQQLKPAAPLTALCPQSGIQAQTDFVLFDGGQPLGDVVANTLELRNSWYLDEAWATASGAVVEYQPLGNSSVLAYHSAKGFSGFKLTPPAAHGKRQTFTLTGVDIYVESERPGPEFGIRVIKPGEPENNGHAPTATWLRDSQGKQELALTAGCSLLSLSLPESWSVHDVANRFILEVREGWDKSHHMKIHRIVIKGFSPVQ